MTAPFLLTDTHCHLNHERLAEDLPDVLAHAAEAGVERLLVVGFDRESSREAVRLAEMLPGVYAAVGVHPHDARHYDAETEAELRGMAENPRVVALGEIGLDYHYDFSPREAQFAAFRAQTELARETGLPIILHCREAYGDVLEVLAEENAAEIGGVMHCWAGTAAEAERALSLGLYLGIGGVLTFKNAGELRDIARTAPEDRLLVETDAPYLAPVPHRGKRNEPAYVALVAQALAQLRDIPLEALAKTTSRNAETLFPRLRPK